MKRAVPLLVLLAGSASLVAFSKPAPPARWFKGNTHTHTNASDGDSPPGVVARWYRDHDYDFLVLSDHNVLVPVAELQSTLRAENRRAGRKPFLLIPGEEVTDNHGERQLHVNGLGTKKVVGKQGGTSARDVLQRCIDGILRAGGFPSLNHPNFRWSVTANDIAALERLQHFEIFNGIPDTNDLGGGGRPGLEAVWDDLLTRGHRLYGVAVDDAHTFTKWGEEMANPGRGFVVVRAAALEEGAILAAMRRGDFYASTGVELGMLTSDDRTLALHIRERPFEKYTTEFVGPGGRVLHVDHGLTPKYVLKSAAYVRARVTSSMGQLAWTQPLFAP